MSLKLGPIEEAIHKSITFNSASSKPGHEFLKGVIITLLAGSIVFLIVKYKKSDKESAS
jgi:hypothetical protein